MKKNKLREGIKSNKKLKDSFYYFIVDNRIDWAIILGSVFCILPYLASQDWYFIAIKSLILFTIIFFSMKYLKTWNELRDVDHKMKEATAKIKKGIKDEKINNTENIAEFQKEFSDKIILLANDYNKKSNSYKDFTEYIKYDKEIPVEMEDFLNKDTDLTRTFISLSMGLLLVLNDLRVLPKLRLKNYYRLLFILLWTIIFFIIYAIENSI